jgi:3',5'-cyclic AMP phosphodiesterase CpdA
MLTRRQFVAASVASLPFIARGAAKPALSLGLVADPQYADIDPLYTRFYRQSIDKLGAAMDHFNSRDLDFCVNVGDTIDQHWASFDAILKPFATCRHKVHHVLGNHDFDLPDDAKPNVPKRLGMEGRYYSVTRGNFCFAMLDTNDVSIHGAVAGTPQYTNAVATLKQTAATGVIYAQPWNGAVGPAQMQWLEDTYRKAAEAKQKVILFAHHPIFPALNNHNAWNSEALLKFAQRNRNVVAWINGHNHQGAYGVYEGVHCLTLKGMVETKDTNSFSVAQLFDDRMVITGTGREPSRELVFRAA